MAAAATSPFVKWRRSISFGEASERVHQNNNIGRSVFRPVAKPDSTPSPASVADGGSDRHRYRSDRRDCHDQFLRDNRARARGLGRWLELEQGYSDPPG